MTGASRQEIAVLSVTVEDDERIHQATAILESHRPLEIEESTGASDPALSKPPTEGDDERERDSCFAGTPIQIAARAGAADVRVTLEVWPNMIHVWPLFFQQLTDGRCALATAGSFIRAATG
jgi:hypothetical protein